MTARDLIESSMRLIGAIAPRENASAAEAADALDTLNSLISSLSVESLMIYESKKEAPITLVPGTATYQLGPSGSITTRPMSIDFATIQIGNTEYQMKIVSDDEYAEIINKSIQSTIPLYLWDNGGYPTRTIYIFPVPSAANSIILYTSRPLDQVTSLDSTMDLPPGYMRMLRYNLAIDLAPEYGRPITQDIAQVAMDSKATVKRANFKPNYLECDIAVAAPSGFNINTGGSYR